MEVNAKFGSPQPDKIVLGEKLLALPAPEFKE